ncbi:MAG: response regulator transcription factor [Frankiaceae bacterium]
MGADPADNLSDSRPAPANASVHALADPPIPAPAAPAASASDRAGGARILIVEDDEPSRSALARSLERYGYTVVEAAESVTALAHVGAGGVDLVILDVGLPGADGFVVLTKLRQLSAVPVLILSGRAEEVDRIVGLELGADDYVVKPYSLRELIARVRARLRRTDNMLPKQTIYPEEDDALVYDEVRIDRRAREVRVGGKRVPLTAREYELLSFLAAHPRRVFSREELLERVWGTKYQDPATVTEHVRRVRAKLEKANAARRLTTLRGMGYRFDP